MLVKTFCAAVNGLEVTTVTVEVSMSRGVLYHLTGLPDNAVKESHDRIAAAMQNNGYKFPVADITRFEKEFFEFLNTKYPQVPSSIAESKVISDEIEAKLIQAIEEFKTIFQE